MIVKVCGVRTPEIAEAAEPDRQRRARPAPADRRHGPGRARADLPEGDGETRLGAVLHRPGSGRGLAAFPQDGPRAGSRRRSSTWPRLRSPPRQRPLRRPSRVIGLGQSSDPDRPRRGSAPSTRTTPTSSSSYCPARGTATGSPDGLRFWKVPDRYDVIRTKAFRVGLIYGPSGCGKSSMVKVGSAAAPGPSGCAGLYRGDGAGETEPRLLRGIRKRFPALPANSGLVEVADHPSPRPGASTRLARRCWSSTSSNSGSSPVARSRGPS